MCCVTQNDLNCPPNVTLMQPALKQGLKFGRCRSLCSAGDATAAAAADNNNDADVGAGVNWRRQAFCRCPFRC